MGSIAGHCSADRLVRESCLVRSVMSVFCLYAKLNLLTTAKSGEKENQYSTERWAECTLQQKSQFYVS